MKENAYETNAKSTFWLHFGTDQAPEQKNQFPEQKNQAPLTKKLEQIGEGTNSLGGSGLVFFRDFLLYIFTPYGFPVH